MHWGPLGKLCLGPGGFGRGPSLPLDTRFYTTSTVTVPSSLGPPWPHHIGRDQKEQPRPDSWLCSQLSPALPKDDSQVLALCVTKG